MSLFIKKGKFCIITRDIFEPREKLNQRGWFSINRRILSKYEYTEVVKLSHVYINNKYYKCKYDNKLMEKIK